MKWHTVRLVFICLLFKLNKWKLFSVELNLSQLQPTISYDRFLVILQGSFQAFKCMGNINLERNLYAIVQYSLTVKQLPVFMKDDIDEK